MATSRSVREGQLSVGIDQEDGSLVLRASGEIDIATAKTLREELLRAFSSDTVPLVLDLTAVSFIDSAGLRLLLWAAGRSPEDGDRLRIVCGSGAVRRMIEMTGLERSLPLAA